MAANGSARSVFSTASHLLSPQSLDSSSSSTPSRAQSISLSRAGTPLPPLNHLSSSLYPPFRHLDDALPWPATASRRVTTGHRKGSKVSKRTAHGQAFSRRSVSPVVSLPHTRCGHGESSVASTPSGLSRTSHLSSSPSTLTSEVRRQSRPPYPDNASLCPHEFLSRRSLLATRGRPGYPEPLGGASSGYLADELSSGSHNQDTLNEVILAIDVGKDGTVGCAYYIAMEETLVLEEEIPMGGIEAVETLLLRAQPTSIIIPSRAPGNLTEFLERDAHRFDDTERFSGAQGPYILRHIASAQFDYEASREALARLDQEPSKPGPVVVLAAEVEPARSIGSSAHNQLMRLGKRINLDSFLSVGCAGAVLSDLERRRAAEDVSPGEEECIVLRVRSVEMNTSTDTMLLSADTLLSLQILQSELHPNPQTRSSNSSEPTAKEALSVTGLLQALASSAQGKRMLRQMLLQPSTDLDLIKERHKSIEVLLRAENGEIARHMRKLLRKLKNTKTLLLHVRKGVDRIRGQLSIRVGDWKALLRFAMVSTRLKQATHTLQGTSGIVIFSRICTEIDVKRFWHVGDTIIRTIDFHLSKESGHTEVLPGASEYLDGLRQEFADVCRFLPELKESVVREVPTDAAKHIRHCTILPQLGFLIAVQLDPETGEGIYHGQNHLEGEWIMCFVSEDVVYYKNQLMLDLDSQYGDLPSRIADEEIEVMMALAAAVLEHEEAILSASVLFGQLDTLLALALAAEKYNWAPPTMTSLNMIDIVGGRHPLQELLVPSYIPNDCVMVGGCGASVVEGDNMAISDGRKDPAPSMLILTGPNNSGKSIYMRQVALIVYLAHTGSYVPATRATIGVTDRILTRIATRETVVNDESAFLVDLKQAAFSMNFATRRSLLLVDEFGKGTTAESGSALLAAYLTYFLDLEAEQPKVLAGTHFHEVFDNGLLRSEKDVTFCHMNIRFNPEAEDPEEQVIFLFQLLSGRGSSSLGVLCAAANDVPSDVINRAAAIVALQDKNESLVEACSDLSEEDKQELEQAELVARRFLSLQVPSSGCKPGDSATVREMLQVALARGAAGRLGP